MRAGENVVRHLDLRVIVIVASSWSITILGGYSNSSSNVRSKGYI